MLVLYLILRISDGIPFCPVVLLFLTSFITYHNFWIYFCICLRAVWMLAIAKQFAKHIVSMFLISFQFQNQDVFILLRYFHQCFLNLLVAFPILYYMLQVSCLQLSFSISVHFPFIHPDRFMDLKTDVDVFES